jgi:uncharacterized membrane protein
MTVNTAPENHSHQKCNLWLLLGVCILGIMIASTWYIYTPDGALNKLDAVGYAVCHRIPSHSFTIDGRPMPLCARCSGMYLGALFGIFYQFIQGKRRGGFARKWLIVLCLLGIPFIVDGLNSFSGLIIDNALLYPPQNWIRFITGLDVGLLISMLIFPLFVQTAWQTWSPEAAISGRGAKVVIVIGSISLIIGILSGSSFILYPLAILSTLGVMIILTLIYTVIMLMLFKQENRYNNFIEMAPVLLGGIVLAMMQIGLFDLVRFLLTETWSGLPL